MSDTVDRTEVLNTYTTDMAAVEGHIATALGHQLDSDELRPFADAQTVIRRLKTTLEGHVAKLEAYNDETEGGGLKEALKDAVGTALGVAAGLYDRVRPNDTASRMIRDTYTATSLATISYHMLYTTALGLKSERVASMALANLKELTPFVMDLSETVCRVVAAELENEDKVYTDRIAEEAVKATQTAWSQDA